MNPHRISFWAHPRTRGENASTFSVNAFNAGSSPLTRGKPVRVLAVRGDLGLIPAHAGKTWAFRFPRLWTGAHPRSRGENIQASSPSRVHAGSSPLTRGKRFPALVVGVSWGLIPAHAGKTRRWARPRRWSRAHPRSRGENRFSVSAGSTLAGSSPLTRGKRRRGRRCRRARRLIPAHAGKTSKTRVSSRMEPAHPRSRGEN